MTLDAGFSVKFYLLILQSGDSRKDSGGVEDMLLHLNARMQALCRIIGEYRNVGLHEDFARVHTGIDIMYRATGLTGTGFKSLTPGFHTGESRQQCGVNIENTSGECAEQRLLHQAHETGQTHHIDIQCLQLIGHSGLNLQRELILVTTAVHDLGRHAVLTGALQDVGIGIVGKHDDDLSIKAAILNGVEDRLAITAGAGTEYS